MSAAASHVRALSRVERASNRRALLPAWRLDVVALSRARAAAMDDAASDSFAVECMRLAQLGLHPFAIAEFTHAPRLLVGRVLGRLEPPSPPASSTRAGMVSARASGRCDVGGDLSNDGAAFAAKE